MVTYDKDIMSEIASDDVIERAYAWLCERRKDYSANNDVWQLRWRWQEGRSRLQADLLSGKYRLGAVHRIRGDEGEIELWSAPDALVLKATAIVLSRKLKRHLSPNCYHLAGNGGSKAAVRAVAAQLDGNGFVFRTDVRSYYASIDQDMLFGMLERYVKDSAVLDLLWNYVYRTVYDEGHYVDLRQGIGLGCPLSPLMGALFLKALDDRLEKTGLLYVRFMDDIVILAPTRWKLRRAIKTVNATLADLKLQKHPKKTFIGKVKQGFDFLGYTITTSGLGIAPKTWARFVERVTRLYEQDAGPSRIGDYVRHWWRWAQAGVSLKVETSVLAAFEMSRPPTSTTRHNNAYDPDSHSLVGTLVLQVQKKRIARSAPTSFIIRMPYATVCSYNSHMIEPDFNSQFKL